MAAVELDSRAMASAVRVVAVGGAGGLADDALSHLRHLERLWTRFSPDSDITRLNVAGGSPVIVAPETLVLIMAMVDGWRTTGGRYDPSSLPSVVALGYGASVEDPTRTTWLPPDARPGADLALVEVDPSTSTVRLPSGAALDPGGIGKGLAADLVVDRLLKAGAEGALVSVGGDLAVAGPGPGGGPWSIAVERPHACGRTLCTLRLDHGGIATSSTISRTWPGPAGDRHHLIDPRTSQPAATDLAAVTAVCATAWQAEVMATAALLAGADDAAAYLSRQGVDGLAVARSGAVSATPALANSPIVGAVA